MASRIAERLSGAAYTSKTAVFIDSAIVLSVFGQRTVKKLHRTHHVQSLAVTTLLEESECKQIKEMFTRHFPSFDIRRPSNYMNAADNLAMALYRTLSSFKKLGPEAKDVLSWCIAAHSMIIHPDAAVKLSTVTFGPDKNLGFAIHARRLIVMDEMIPELIGMMPMDNTTQHSNLSSIQPHTTQNQHHQLERVLFGPIRFINHLCVDFNAEYVAVEGKSAFLVQAIRNISPGEELTVDYGKGFFEDKGGCPCITCRPIVLPQECSGDRPKRSAVEEIAEKKRNKRRRRDTAKRLSRKAN